MKQKFLLIPAALCCLSSVYAQKNYEMGNPKDEANYGYLKSYRPLKEYIDYEKYPNFKLGIGTTVSEYLKGGTVAEVTNGYFTETVAGNAMKMSSCVNNSGDMNFTQVTNYVNAATKAGLNVYGHTLAWHSQQPVGWLRSLIKDRPAPELIEDGQMVPVDVATKDFRVDNSIGWSSSTSDFGYSLSYSPADGLNVHTTKICPNSWDVQFLAATDIPLEKGTDCKVILTVRGSKAGTLHTKLGDWNSGVSLNVPFTTEWQDIEISYKKVIGSSFYMLQCGDFVGDIYIKKIVFQTETWGKIITDDHKSIVVKATAKAADPWDNQFWIVTGDIPANSRFEFSAEVRAEKPASVGTQLHGAPGSYIDSQALGNVNFTTEWTTVKSSGTINKAGQSIAFNLNDFAQANNYYFSNISLKINGVEKVVNGSLTGTDMSSFREKLDRGSIVPSTISEGSSYVYVPTVPLTDKERLDTLVFAMDKWIKGMMNACGGKVKAWDVVNEAISGGGDDGQGFYTLQHNPSSTTDFFWQDHMGDLEYVRQAVRLARKYGPEDIKLFINDYNLESDWDGNKKLKSLINWIKKWEADGVTHIDGIGSQMHISCYMNESTQTSKKNAITNMLRLMAATGKLVRISELDMGMVDINGKDVPTSQMTEAMHKRMADLYEWIVKQYLAIVPVEQQWGICQWCGTDSPSNSGWRADTPVGLWTLDYYRKHAYAGIARGLGADITALDELTTDPASSDAIYDIHGRRLQSSFEALPSGLYIIGGKKVIKR